MNYFLQPHCDLLHINFFNLYPRNPQNSSSSSVCVATIICVALLNELVLDKAGLELVGIELLLAVIFLLLSQKPFFSRTFTLIHIISNVFFLIGNALNYLLSFIFSFSFFEIFQQSSKSHSLNPSCVRPNTHCVTAKYWPNYFHKIPALCFP